MERVRNSFPQEQRTVVSDVLGMDVGLHARARIAAAVAAATLPPETTTAILPLSTCPVSSGARPHRGRRLARELGAAVEPAERLLDRLLGDQDRLGAVRAEGRERGLAGERRGEPVRDRVRRDGDGAPGRQALVDRPRALRLDADHAPVRRGRSDAGDQPAAAARHEDRLDLGRVLEQLQARPCPGPRSRLGRRTGGRACGRSRRSAPRAARTRRRARSPADRPSHRSLASRRSSPRSPRATSRRVRPRPPRRPPTRVPVRGCRPRSRSRPALAARASASRGC